MALPTDLNTAHLPADSPYLRNTCDVVLVCGGQRFPAHKALLALKSKVLREAFDATEGGEEEGAVGGNGGNVGSATKSTADMAARAATAKADGGNGGQAGLQELSCFEGHSAQEMSDLLRLLYSPQTFTLPPPPPPHAHGTISGNTSTDGGAQKPVIQLLLWQAPHATKKQVEQVADVAASVLPLACKLDVEDVVSWFDEQLNVALQVPNAVPVKETWLKLALLCDRHHIPRLLARCEHHIGTVWTAEIVQQKIGLAQLSSASLHRVLRVHMWKGSQRARIADVLAWQGEYTDKAAAA